MEIRTQNLTEWVGERLQSLRFLNELWEKSQEPEKNNPNFLKAQLVLIEDILKEIVPKYAELMDKEELDPKEVWILKYIQDTFGLLLFSLAHAMYFQGYLSLSQTPAIPKELAEKALRIYKFLAELAGYTIDKDIYSQEQIEKSEEDIKAGRVKPFREVFSQLGI